MEWDILCFQETKAEEDQVKLEDDIKKCILMDIGKVVEDYSTES